MRFWQFRQPQNNLTMESFISIPLVAKVTPDIVITTATVPFNAHWIRNLAIPSATDIAYNPGFTGTQSSFEVWSFEQNQQRIDLYYSSLTVAQILALINAANSNVPGLGTAGDAVLVAGTVAVTIPGLTASNKVVLTRHIANTTSLTVEYQYAVTTNTLTITAAVAAGTINVADISTITYAVVA